jgi:anaerobic ribonucleoside-triphosphate reductase activating protein
MSIEEILEEINKNKLTDITFSGGEPFIQSKDLIVLAKQLKEIGKNIWSFTGFEFEQLLKNQNHKDLLQYIDVLVDGRFELDKRDLSLLYKGSSNQRIIDVKRSLEKNKIVLYY